MNPLEAFLSEYGPTEKTAGFGSAASSAANMFPDQLTQGLATAGAGAMIAGAGVGMNALYGAVTKGRDFRKMLSFNEDLAAMHKENPKYVNAAFSTLHRMNRDFSKDPMVSGGFVRQMVTSPEAAFGYAGQAAGFAPKPGPIEAAGMQGIGSGIQPGGSMSRMGEIAEMQAQVKEKHMPPKPAPDVGPQHRGHRTGRR